MEGNSRDRGLSPSAPLPFRATASQSATPATTPATTRSCHPQSHSRPDRNTNDSPLTRVDLCDDAITHLVDSADHSPDPSYASPRRRSIALGACVARPYGPSFRLRGSQPVPLGHAAPLRSSHAMRWELAPLISLGVPCHALSSDGGSRHAGLAAALALGMTSRSTPSGSHVALGLVVPRERATVVRHGR